MTKKRTSEDMTGGNAEYRDPLLQFEEHMRAADDLIESFEGEVAELRRDLEEARGALQVAHQEMAARGRALEGLSTEDLSRAAAEEEVRKLRAEISAVRQQNADEQLRMSNKHIADMDALRRDLEEQRRAEVAAAESESKIGALREEFRKERAALEERHESEIENLKRASEQWEEQLREGYRELEERHSTKLEKLRGEHQSEVETLRAEAEGEKIELERALREELGRRREEELRTLRGQHAAELQVPRRAAASRERQLQKELQELAEAHRVEVQQLRIEMEKAAAEAEERRKKDVREIKSLAEGRERELRRAQAIHIGEEKEATERRIAALKAQREADINSLRERNAEETTKVRQDLETRLAAAEERHKSEVAQLNESLEDAARQESEARLHAKQQPERGQNGEMDTVAEALERRLAESEAERASLEQQTAGLRDALKEARATHDGLRETLEPSAREGADGREQDEGSAVRVINKDLERRLTEEEKARVMAEERAQDLASRLRETEEESRRLEQELERAMENLQRSLDPEQRLRAGLALFNGSDHTRTVSSISKALGLPKVHVSPDGGPVSPIKKPVITFVWGDMAWRRYVSDPTDGVEEPRVYLIGAGDDPSDIHRPDLAPNARMDARGRLILGVQAF
ncbi:hypothetical protein BH24ACT19_BH24ACT19_10360 [soil metagenome]